MIIADASTCNRVIDPIRDVYTVPVADAYLVYSPLRRVSALVNREALHRTKALLAGRGEDLCGGGEIRSIYELLESSTVRFPPLRTGALSPFFLGIIPTRSCNLSCGYCGFGASQAPEDFMDLKLAVAAVDWMAELIRREGRDVLEIHFFGGEPFVAPELVDVVVHRARAVAAERGLSTYFEAATNGVMGNRQARFVGDYFDAVILSLDGVKSVHDRHRPMKNGAGSFDRVALTAKRLSRSSTKLCFRVCVSEENVIGMANTVQWLYETFNPSIINFETLKPTDGSAAAGLNPPDPFAFAVHCIRATLVAKRLGIRVVYAAGMVDEPRHSFCPVGKDVLILSPDGRLSGCYLPKDAWLSRGLDLDIGRMGRDGSVHIDMAAVESLRLMVTHKPKCDRCFCRWTCAGGCHVSNTPPGASIEYGDFCIQTRIITACNLMSELGMGSRIDDLLRSPSAMERLAFQETDHLFDQTRGCDAGI